MRTLLLAIFSLAILASYATSEENNIICTYTHSFTPERGHVELQPSSFSVTVYEDKFQNALAVSIGPNGNSLCPYNNIAEYSKNLMWFDECERQSWLSEDRATPEGFLKIDRMTGEFTEYTTFPDKKDAFLLMSGTCRAASQKF